MVKIHHQLHPSRDAIRPGWLILPLLNLSIAILFFLFALVVLAIIDDRALEVARFIARLNFSYVDWTVIGGSLGILSAAATCVAIQIFQRTSPFTRILFVVTIHAIGGAGLGFSAGLLLDMAGARTTLIFELWAAAATVTLSIGTTGFVGTYCTSRFRRLGMRLLRNVRRN